MMKRALLEPFPDCHTHITLSFPDLLHSCASTAPPLSRIGRSYVFSYMFRTGKYCPGRVLGFSSVVLTSTVSPLAPPRAASGGPSLAWLPEFCLTLSCLSAVLAARCWQRAVPQVPASAAHCAGSTLPGGDDTHPKDSSSISNGRELGPYRP